MKPGIIALCVWAAAACSVPSPYDIDHACDTMTGAECRFQHGCCEPHERASIFTDEQTCIDEVSKVGCPTWAPAFAAHRAGRFVVDQAKLRACLEPAVVAMEACDAEALHRANEARAECFEIPGVGTVVDHGTCYSSFECATPGAVCRIEPPREGLVDVSGFCSPPVRLGEPCEPGDCGLFGACEPDIDGTCVAAGVDGERCADDGSCSTGLVCDGFCRIPGEPGAPCFSSQGCARGACDFDTGRCGALREDGDSCNEDRECESGACLVGGPFSFTCGTRVFDTCDGL